MMKTLLTACLFALCLSTALAQKIKRPETYNYQRGFEAMAEENYDEALNYFVKEADANPKGGYAHLMIAGLKLQQEEYGRALMAVDEAIKYIPSKDAEYAANAYRLRASVYLNLEDTAKALADLTTAIKKFPKQTELYKSRGNLYYDLSEYALSDADFHKMIALEPGDVYGYMGLGRNAKAQERWDDAIKQYNYALKLDSEYSLGYAFRAEAYVGKAQWIEAIDDIISALRIDRDDKAFYLALSLQEPALSQFVSKVKIQSTKEPNNAYWPYMIGLIYYDKNDYEHALDYFNTANGIDKHPNISEKISLCQHKLGLYDEALASIEEALNMDTTDMDYYEQKTRVLYAKDNLTEALAELNNILAKDPEAAFAYYRRANIKEITGDIEGAIEDYTMLITLAPDNAYGYSSRGFRYLRQGKTALAEADFQKAIALEDTPEKYAVSAYAYQALGQYDKAIAVLDTIIAHDSTSAEVYYNAACVYALMQDEAKALYHLEKALAMGYKSFTQIKYDHDLTFLRDKPAFKALIRQYNTPKAKAKTTTSSATATVTTEVPFTKENGTCKVKCTINDLPLYFVFDTGASNVTLSMVEATFMMKNGHITKSDIIGNQRYMDANGNVNVGTVINLKSVNFGGLQLNNVRASVVRNQKAPLLLGQSVLSKLGKIEIDNAASMLKITSL